MAASSLDTVIAVPPTPFLEDGALDETGFERILERVVAGGVTAVTIAGNTGEFAALAPDEIERLIEIACATIGTRAAILVGVGGDLATATGLAKRASAAGAFGVMVHEPSGPFRAPAGWVRYHVELARAVPALAVVPYVRDPAVSAEDVDELVAAAPNVVALKYAVPDPVRLADLVAGGPGLLWICGLAEGWAPFFWPAGATAFTSGLAVIEPRLSLELLAHLRAGRAREVAVMWSLIRPFEALRARDHGAASVPAIKEALVQRCGIGRAVRPPISALGIEDRREIGRILASWDQVTADAVS